MAPVERCEKKIKTMGSGASRARGPPVASPSPEGGASGTRPDLAPLRVIFLDVDGVLVCERSLLGDTTEDDASLIHCSFNAFGAIERSCLDCLARVVHAARAKIVLSSTWRMEPQMREFLVRSLAAAGLPDAVIGDTCDLGDTGRGFEILAWLQEHAAEVASFVILEDSDTHIANIVEALSANAMDPGSRYVQPTIASGLTSPLADRAILILEALCPGAAPSAAPSQQPRFSPCVGKRREEESARIFEPVKFVLPLQCERGLHLVRYGGGSDFRESESLLHFAQVGRRNCDVNAELVKEVIARVTEAYAARTEDDSLATPLPALGSVAWDSCEWDFAFHVSSPVRGDDLGRPHRCNLFHQGWLLEQAAEQGVYGRAAYPLIGILAVDASGGIVYDPGDGDALGEGPSAPFVPAGGVLKAADQHIHKVDALAGGSLEEYVSLLMENGLSQEDATVFAQAEIVGADDYYMGADMARVRLRLARDGEDVARTSDSSSAIVLCVDLQEPSVPRVLVTFLVVVLSAGTEAAVKELRKGALGQEPVAMSTLEELLGTILLLDQPASPARGTSEPIFRQFQQLLHG